MAVTCLAWTAAAGGLGLGFTAFQPIAPAATAPAMMRTLRSVWRFTGWIAIVRSIRGLAQHFRRLLDKMTSASGIKNAQVRC